MTVSLNGADAEALVRHTWLPNETEGGIDVDSISVRFAAGTAIVKGARVVIEGKTYQALEPQQLPDEGSILVEVVEAGGDG